MNTCMYKTSLPDSRYALPSNNDFVFSSEDPATPAQFQPDPVQTHSQGSKGLKGLGKGRRRWHQHHSVEQKGATQNDIK